MFKLCKPKLFREFRLFFKTKLFFILFINIFAIYYLFFHKRLDCVTLCPYQSIITHEWLSFDTSHSVRHFSEFICPQNFRNLADWIYGWPDNEFDERIYVSTSQGQYISSCLPPGSIIFVKTDSIEEFFKIVYPTLQNSFVLITGQSDASSPGIFLPYLEDTKSKIIHWFGQNADILSSATNKFTPIPIGINCYEMSQAIRSIYQVNQNDTVQSIFGGQDEPLQYIHPLDLTRRVLSGKFEDRLLLVNFQQRTDHTGLRRQIWTKLCNQTALSNFVVCIEKSEGVNITALPSVYGRNRRFPFWLSPRGNGLDSHRTWEALYLDIIPIVWSSPLNPIYIDLPVIVINQLDDITEQFLRVRLKEIAERKMKTPQIYHTEKLRFSYWRQMVLSKSRHGVAATKRQKQCWRANTKAKIKLSTVANYALSHSDKLQPMETKRLEAAYVLFKNFRISHIKWSWCVSARAYIALLTIVIVICFIYQPLSLLYPSHYSNSEEFGKYLLIEHLSEQLGKAKFHLLEQMAISRLLKRTVVLPNVGDSEIGLRLENSFDYYYQDDDLQNIVPVLSVKEFSRSVMNKDIKRPLRAVLVFIGELSCPEQKASWNNVYSNVFKNILKKFTVKRLPPLCFLTSYGWKPPVLPDIIIKQLSTLHNDTDIIVTIKQSSLFLMDPNRLPVHILKHNKTLISMAEGFAQVSAPYLAIHWRMEGGDENGQVCAQKLIEATRNVSSMQRFNNIYFASDHPNPSERLISNSFVQSRTDQTLGYYEVIKTLRPLTFRNLSFHGTIIDSGALSIVEKIICEESAFFLAGYVPCDRTGAYGREIVKYRQYIVRKPWRYWNNFTGFYDSERFHPS